MGLTEEQRAMIEQKKAQALAKKNNRLNAGPLAPLPSNVPSKTSDNSSSSLVAELNKAAANARKFAAEKGSLNNSSYHRNHQSVTTTVPSKETNSSLSLNDYSHSLSENQKRLMEEKRRAALAKKQSINQTATVHIPTDLRKATSTSNFYSSCPPKTIKGNCVLVTKSRFEVDVGFHNQLIQTFKEIGSGQYNAKKKTWNFDMMDHDNLLNKAKSLKPEVELSPLPLWVLQTFKSSRTLLPENIDISEIEPYLHENLMPFQKEGIQYGVSRQGRVLIADDMGLGKTIQALGLASYYRQAWPVLVICPSTMRYSWEASVSRWLPSVSKQDINVISSGKDFIGQSLFTIISFDLVNKKSEDLRKKNFQFVIVDESHMIKDSKSARSKAAEPFMKNAKYLVLLSGTPALSRPIELFSQLQALDTRLFRWVSDFGNRYCDGKIKKIGAMEIPDYNGSSNMQELSLLLNERCMIRRLKTDVLEQLPSKQRCLVVLDPAGVDTSSKVMKDKRKENEKDQLKGMERRAFILEWFNDTATAKLKAVQDYIKDLVTTKEQKFLVFAHHQVILKGIIESLQKLKVGFIVIDGSVPSSERKTRVDSFQTHDKIKVAVLSITAANAGITLTAAQLVVFAELFWNPGILTQAEDRAHRIGQTDSVIVQYLVAKDTADDVLWPMIQQKLDVLNKAGLSKDNFEESEAKIMEDSRQKKIDGFFKPDSKEEMDTLWDDVNDDCFFIDEEPPAKRLKT